MTKNATRIASVLGTWTAETHLKSLIGNFQVRSYLLIHLMPDPMRGYGCHLDDCDELDNYVCINQDENHVEKQKCVSMEEEVVDWSDLSVFLFFGAKVDAGVPFGVHIEHDTGDWVGPFNIILAQNDTAVQLDEDASATIVDRYKFRYVQTPTTPYLHMPANTTLFGPDDFDNYMGQQAVQETIRQQSHIVHGQDPYEKFLGTCDKGNVAPILPIAEFQFSRDCLTGREQLNVEIDYKIMAMPPQSRLTHDLMPLIQESFNSHNNRGFHVSGPYCYADDPERAWTFDFNFNSSDQRAGDPISLFHGCLEGLPCLPPAAALSGSTAGITFHNNAAQDQATVVDLDKMLITFLCYVLALGLLVALTCNVQIRKRHRRVMDRVRFMHEDEVLAAGRGELGSPFMFGRDGRRRRIVGSTMESPLDMVDEFRLDDSLQQPLLSGDESEEQHGEPLDASRATDPLGASV